MKCTCRKIPGVKEQGRTLESRSHVFFRLHHVLTGAILSAALITPFCLGAEDKILYNKRLIEQEHRYAEALANLQTAVAKDRKSAPLQYWLSIAYFKNDHFAEAAAAMERAFSLKLYKTYHITAYEFLGASYNQIGNYQQALIAFDKALALDPNRPDSQSGRATAMERIQAASRAVADQGGVTVKDAVSPAPAQDTGAATPATQTPAAPAPQEPRIIIGSITVIPEKVAAGELFEVNIELFAEAPQKEQKDLAVTLLYSIRREGRTVKSFDPETFDATNGEATVLRKKTRASKTAGDYELSIELQFQGQRTQKIAPVRIN